MFLIYDLETSGLPAHKLPSTDPAQPFVVELAAMLLDADGSTVSSFSAVLLPRRFGEPAEIPADVAEIHGIDTEMAERVGEDPQHVFSIFWGMWKRALLRVAHNEAFDARMVRIGLIQAGFPVPADQWKADGNRASCTQKRMRAWWSAEYPGVKNEAGFRLVDCLELAGIRPMGEAHGALVDAMHAAALHRWLNERGF